MRSTANAIGVGHWGWRHARSDRNRNWFRAGVHAELSREKPAGLPLASPGSYRGDDPGRAQPERIHARPRGRRIGTQWRRKRLKRRKSATPSGASPSRGLNNGFGKPRQDEGTTEDLKKGAKSNRKDFVATGMTSAALGRQPLRGVARATGQTAREMTADVEERSIAGSTPEYLQHRPRCARFACACADRLCIFRTQHPDDGPLYLDLLVYYGK